MKRMILIAFLLMTVVACGPGGPDSAGPITTPTSDTTTSIPDPTTTTIPTTDTSRPSDSGPTTTSVPAPSTSTTTPDPGGGSTASSIAVYFLDQDGTARAVQRSVTTHEVARAAVQALITGPTSGESAVGLSTAVPADTLILGLRVDDGTAVVDLSQEFEAGAGSLSILGRLAQVVYSLTEFGSVERVRFLVDGRAVEVFSSEGVVLGETVARRDFTAAIPIGALVEGGSAPTWAQNDLPEAAVTLGSPDTYRVVLVAGDDLLNVRDTPGVDGAIIGRLEPGVAVRAAGQTREVGTSRWLTVETPAGAGWVNGFYLTRSVAANALAEGDALTVVRQLADRWATGEDISALVSSKGLWVAHHAPPIRFPKAELVGILSDPTTYRWGSKALEEGSPEIRPRTFAEAVADRFVGAYHDDNSVVGYEIVEGPNGRPTSLAVPTEFGGFPFVTVYDPGDDPQYDGLDWTGWIVSFAFEDGELRVVGLTLDEWAP